MSASSQEALHQLQAVLTAKHYSPRTIRNYMQEMRFIFAHYPDLLPASITSQHIVSYINFIITAHGVGREKCHQVAQSCSFFFKHVLPSPFVIPSQFYPRKENKLPRVFSVAEVKQLLTVIPNLKHRVMTGLFYGTGLRINELVHVKIDDIDSKSFQIKVTGKGRKDRYTLLPKQLLEDLRKYYLQHKPQTYLFEGQTAGKPMHPRSIQHFIQRYITLIGLGERITPLTRYGILLPPTCWMPVPIYIRSKNCLDIVISVPPWYTCTCSNPNAPDWCRHLMPWKRWRYD